MLIVGLTGSIGMGKSTVANRLRERGIPICDADALVHALYEGEAVAPVEAAFPGVTNEGRIDRQRLSAILLQDPSRFKQLEAIVHPLVQEATRACLQSAHRSGAGVAILEHPLLLEGGAWKRCDLVVVVSAPAEMQRQRVMARPGMTAEKFETILSRQMPDAEKRSRAAYVVDTGVALDETLADVDRIVDLLGGRSGTAYAEHWS